MLLGTDVSIDVCKAEGYTMIKFDGRKAFDRTKEYEIFAHYPNYCIEDSDGEIKKNDKVFEAYLNFDDLMELYEKDKEGIDSLVGNHKSHYYDFENPTYYDFLHLADDINSYKGLI